MDDSESIGHWALVNTSTNRPPFSTHDYPETGKSAIGSYPWLTRMDELNVLLGALCVSTLGAGAVPKYLVS